MQITGNEKLTHSAQKVFETLRDHLADLAKMMPNIEDIEILERREEPPDVHLYSQWQGSQHDVPSVLRPFVKKDLLRWHDRATWNADQRTSTWEIEAAVGREIFSCKGVTTIIPEGEDQCTFSLQGELKVDPAKVPGVPKFLARKLQDPLERFVAKAISPNLTSIAGAVQKFLDQK